jgi:outer membrane biosynthesis protein TonB
MKENNGKIGGIVGTILFHAGLLLLFFLLGLSTPLPLPGEEGVEVNLGYSDQGMGADQQLQPAPAEEIASPPPQVSPREEEKIVTQETEDAPSIEKPKKEKPKPVTKPAEETPKEEKPEEKPAEQPKVNPKALYKGKSTTTTEGGQEGQTGQPGDQGNPNGDPNAPNYDGTGGKGDGPGFDLGGRGARSLPSPSYNSNDQGDVVVEIFVDRDGNVISARPGVKGTTTNDAHLWDVARDAAMRSKFDADPNAAEKQKGTITYKFRRTGG